MRDAHMSSSCSVSYRNTGPLHIVGGAGSRLFDVNGVAYLDTRNNVAHCGHGHPEIVRAVTYQAEHLNVRSLRGSIYTVQCKVTSYAHLHFAFCTRWGGCTD